MIIPARPQYPRLDLRGYLVVNRNNLGILLRVGVKVGIYKIRLTYFLPGIPRINLSTVHKSKGGECDNVVLMTDLSRANSEEMEIDSDDTNRVFYVGATRAKQSLHIINPQQERGFII